MRARWERADEPLALDAVPPLVFSEIMRDVDMFVGVASVGNDPNWADGGPGGTYRDYWQSYSFGELSATAQTRRVLLERLLPRLWGIYSLASRNHLSLKPLTESTHEERHQCDALRKHTDLCGRR